MILIDEKFRGVFRKHVSDVLRSHWNDFTATIADADAIASHSRTISKYYDRPLYHQNQSRREPRRPPEEARRDEGLQSRGNEEAPCAQGEGGGGVRGRRREETKGLTKSTLKGIN